MKRFAFALSAIFLFCLSASLLPANASHPSTPAQRDSALNAIQLIPVVTSGLASSVFVTHAHDGNNRLFIVEKRGSIRVYKNGSLLPTAFLDIATSVLSTGNEQGMLGLAFHPNFPSTPHFFVYYTRQTDGALTIARYSVPTPTSDVADAASGVVFLTVPHPSFTNHNGGMMAFGPDDGYLYIGMGDGGSANDPNNNAQNINQYLGKIHRIDVDHANGSIPYSSPQDNPFFGATPGLDEIYAYGIRNPWRFSFDRGGTHQLYLGDVGQGTREEIDIVVNGGNYGWRIMEGFICNPAFPPNCTPPSGYVPPIVDYSHINGRCSLTGGYVYRGAGGVFPTGAYIYGDYCTGEIFQLIGTTQTLLYNTSLDFNLASFGEDEAGEMYVVSLAGAIYRLGSCSNSILPTSNSVSSDGGTNFMVALSTASSCAWTVASNDAWITVTSSANGIGNSTVTYNVAANTSTSPRSGTITIGNQTFTVNQAGMPTAVELISFQAIANEDGTTLKWQTGFETHNLGFRLWRDDGSKRVAINQHLIAGSALKTSAPLTSGDSYTWADSAILGYQNVTYWLEDVDLNGTSIWHGPFSVEKAAGSKQMAESRSALLKEINADDSTTSTSAVVERKAEPVKPRQTAQVEPAAVNLASAIKISIAHEGWYRLSASELFAAGLPQNADPRLLQLFADGIEVPIAISKSEEKTSSSLLSPLPLLPYPPTPPLLLSSEASWAIEFYALGLDTPSTDTHAYWLVQGNQAGKRIRQSKGEGVSSSSPSFTQTIERRDRSLYFAALLNGERENFFGAVVTTNAVAQTLTVPHPAADAKAQAELEVTLQGVTLQEHRVLAALNNQDLGFITFDVQQLGRGKFTVPQSLLREGTNTVRLIAQNGTSDVSLADTLRLSYRHTFDADSDALKFTTQAGEAVTIQGFSSAAVRVFDITDANNVEEVIGKIVEAKAGGFAVTVAAQGSGERLLLALADNQAKHPTAIRAAPPSTLEQNADLLIITARDFFPALEPLKKQRQADGYQTALIDVEDIYNQYNFGNKSPQAIKDFLADAKANWKVKPRFVLLAGDASYDARNYLGFGDGDIVPTKLLDTAFLETASDDWFSDFNNDGIADIATGRLPFHSLSEATAMVAKTLRYGAAKPVNAALLVSDANDGFDFEQAAAQLRALLPGRIKAEDLKRGQLDRETAKRNLFAAIGRGETLVNYNGHGSVNLWRGGLLTADEARTMENQHLPLFVLMNCLNGYYVDAGGESLGEALMKAERGGAVAVWASSGLTEPQAQALLNQELYRALFQKRGMTLGEAIQRAKAATADADLRRTWILLGDPTVQLK